MKPKLKQQDKKDENLKQQRWIGKIKEKGNIYCNYSGYTFKYYNLAK